MTTIDPVLDAALRSHQAGDLARAEQLYRQVLAVRPQQADALHLLGLVCHQTGRPREAVEHITRALELRPDFFEAHYNLGNVLKEQGKPDEAIRSYEQALRLRPDSAETHYNLANLLRDCGQPERAITGYQQALRLRPGYAKAYANLGTLLLDQGKLDEAVAALHQALRLQPQSARAHSNLGNALRAQGRAAEAVEFTRQALRLDPHLAEAHNNLAAALLDLGRIDEALAEFDEALRLRPDYARAHMNRAMAWLLIGDFERGWPEYEWRWQTKDFKPRRFPQPRWDGAPLHGRTILLHAEQGLGDTIQFIRYARLVKERGGRVVLECPRPLLRLLATCPGVDQVTAPDSSLPPFDVHAPLLSLPAILGTTLATVPAAIPYLRADAGLCRHWQSTLSRVPGKKVGIVWRGNPDNPRDRLRSVPLEQFEPLARVPGMRLVSLQRGPGSEEVAALAGRFEVIDLGPRLQEESWTFLDTAAVMACLDLIITIDTAAAHLAGALGAPVWVALPFAADWRWLLNREDSPWYPTMRLFRQTRPGDWDSVFRRLTEALTQGEIGASK